MRLILTPVFSIVLVSSFVGCMSTGTSDLNGPQWGKKPPPSVKGEAYSRYLAAMILEGRGEFDEALKLMESIPELDPEATTPVLRLIRAHLRNQNYDQALVMAQKAVAQQPDAANLWIVTGEIYHKLQQYDKAVDAFSKAIELSPDNVMGYGALVEVQEATNDLIAAIDIYKRLIELKPDAAILHYQLALNLTRISDTKGAQESLQRALALNPNLIRAQYLLGALFLETGDSESAANELRAYLARRPGDVQAMENLAGALVRLGRHGEAIEVYQQILSAENAAPRHNLHMMYVLLHSGDASKAEEFIPATGAPIFGQVLQAMAREAQGLPYVPLVEGLDKIEGDLDNELSTYLNELFYLFGKEETGKFLLTRLEKFRTSVPQSKRLPVVQARTHMLLEQYREAVDLLEPLLADEQGDKRWTHYYLAVSYDELENFEQTEAHLQEYIKLEPNDPDVLNFLGYLYAEKGVKLDEAEALLQKALGLDADNPYYLDSLGWVYYQRGQAQEAIELIQRAIYGMESDDAVLRDHLGDAYMLKGDVERAVAEWERARRLDPKIEGVQEKIEKHAPKKQEA